VPTKPKRKYTISSIDRALRILMILGEREEPMRISEISRKLSIDKSTAYRIVSTLRGQGFVEQDVESRKYILGVKVIEVAGLKLRSIRLVPIAKPITKELMARTHEATHLAVLVEGEVMYLDSEQSSGVFNINTQVGSRAPLHSSAVGKSLLAALPDDEIDQLIGIKGLVRYTDRTIINLADFHRDIDEIRSRGWAMDDEETQMGVRCIAAAICDHRGAVAASVGISGPTQRITRERMHVLGQLVRESAAKISKQLGYSPGIVEPVSTKPDQVHVS
jgi:DNA-binding IclR family transcriptional regulator